MALESSQSSSSDEDRSGADSWLVKSGDRILGPFSTETVGSMILGRELVVLDEITPPKGRWRFIRDVPAFRAIVEEASKNMMNVREETEIGGFENTHVPVSPKSDAYGASNPDRIRDAEFEDVPSTPAANAPINSSKQFGVRTPATAAMAKRSPQSVAMWVAAAIVVICAGYMILSIRRPAAQRGVASLDFDRAFAAAERSWRRGDFVAAERLYMQANRQKPNQPVVVARLAPLMIQLDGSTVEAKRLLSETKASVNSQSDRGVLTDLHLGAALAAMYSGDFTTAESLYSQALSEESARPAALFNLGMIAYLQGRYENALTRFAASGSSPIVRFMTVRSLAALPKRKGGRKEAASILLGLTKGGFDFYQEAQLLSASLLLEAGNKKAADARVKMVIDADPEMTSSHWHDPLLFQSETAWRSLVNVCERLNTGLKSDFSRGLLALCLAKAGQTDNAMTTMNSAMAVSSENEALQAVNAYLLYSTNREADARAALQIALNRPPYPVLGRILKARLCWRANEIDCAESQWTPVSETSGAERLPAMVGLAQIAMRKGQKDKAQELTQKVLGLSPTYKPGMRLREGDES